MYLRDTLRLLPKGLCPSGLPFFRSLLDETLHRMAAHDETILPVLDDEGKILGDPRLSKTLLKALKKGRLDGTQ